MQQAQKEVGGWGLWDHRCFISLKFATTISLSLSLTRTRARAQSCRSHISPSTAHVTRAQMWFKKREEVAQAKAELKVYKEKTNTRQQQAVCVGQQP